VYRKLHLVMISDLTGKSLVVKAMCKTREAA